MFDFKASQLRLIALIVRTRSLSEAATAMGITVSAASRMLKKLQTAMNDPLFVRTWRGLVPTETASSMVPIILQLLNQLEMLDAKKTFDPSKLALKIKIGAVDNAVETILAPVIRQILRVAPKMSFSISLLDSSHLRKLESGELDFSLFPTAQMPDLPPHFHSLNLFRISRSVLLDRRHPLAVSYEKGEELTIEHYKRFPRVVVKLKDSSRKSVYLVDEIKGEYDQSIIEVPYFLGVSAFLERSLYTSLLPDKTARYLSKKNKNLITIPFPSPEENFARIIWHERLNNSVPMQWIRSFFSEYAESCD